MAGAGLARASIVLAALVKKLRRFIVAQTERENCRIPSRIYSSRTTGRTSSEAVAYPSPTRRHRIGDLLRAQRRAARTGLGDVGTGRAEAVHEIGRPSRLLFQPCGPLPDTGRCPRSRGDRGPAFDGDELRPMGRASLARHSAGRVQGLAGRHR